MGFSTLRSVLVLVIMLILISVPTLAIKFSVEAGDSSRAASASGEYRLQDSAFLDSDINLGQGVVSRLSSARGSGENMISEVVSGSGSSVTNTITSDGSFSSTSSDSATGAGAVSDYQTSLAGSSGSICTTSTGQVNEMMVAGGFSGQGDMDVSLSSLAAQEALTTGTASALGTPVFCDELVQGIRGQDMAVSMQGLYKAGEQGLGEFGMAVQNAKSGAAARPQPTAATYKLTGWRWKTTTIGEDEGSFIPIAVSENNLPTSIPYERVASEITIATQTWDTGSSEVLINSVDPGESDYSFASWKTQDKKNVHQWTSDTGLSSNTIAMTVTWSTRAKTALGDDGKLYSQAVESDCWYNNRLAWRIDEDGVGKYSYIDADGKLINTFDIRTIALHELGHTLGLADLYENSNKDQTMYGYNDGTADWFLNSNGDVSGLQKLYGGI